MQHKSGQVTLLLLRNAQILVNLQLVCMIYKIYNDASVKHTKPPLCFLLY